jgi:hypothetical protein
MKDFKTQKEIIKSKLEQIIQEYDEFTKNVSPKHWRTCGEHYTNLKKTLNSIDRYSEITSEEKENLKNYL